MPMTMPGPTIDHLVVLMLENRSFDHLFGFLDHPNPRFPRLTGNERIGKAKVTPTARYQTASPAHSHDAVMAQLFGGESFTNDWRWDYKLKYPSSGNNLGFMQSYRNAYGAASAERIMRCFHPETIPVLATLAKQYAVFTNWYCSVPGETWPNRDFAVAARSFGKVNQHCRPRPKGSSIFEQLAAARRPGDQHEPFRIYHDSVAHTFLYTGLYRRGVFHGMNRFFKDVADGALPRYSYIEPDFGLGSTKWFGRLIEPVIGDAYGNSHHPGQAHSSAEFVAAEHLVAGIYNALLDTMAKHPGAEHESLFARTLFLITYDEHGGFYDRATPPAAAQPSPSDETDAGFKFDILGPRVPAILISPWIEPATVIEPTFEHASIPATARTLFAPEIPPLSRRDAEASRFHLVAIGNDSKLRTPTSSRNPLPRAEPLDLHGALAAMAKHGAPASLTDGNYAPDATLRQDWANVVKTANDLLPRSSLKSAQDMAIRDLDELALDETANELLPRSSAKSARDMVVQDLDELALDVVKRMHGDGGLLP